MQQIKDSDLNREVTAASSEAIDRYLINLQS